MDLKLFPNYMYIFLFIAFDVRVAEFLLLYSDLLMKYQILKIFLSLLSVELTLSIHSSNLIVNIAYFLTQ